MGAGRRFADTTSPAKSRILPGLRQARATTRMRTSYPTIVTIHEVRYRPVNLDKRPSWSTNFVKVTKTFESV
jgi:hypothetical protein